MKMKQYEIKMGNTIWLVFSYEKPSIKEVKMSQIRCHRYDRFIVDEIFNKEALTPPPKK
jgi:hypothetical protein